MIHQFVETSDGVHLVSTNEYTLCGDALEGDPVNGLEETRPTALSTITCVKCADIIRMCRGVRVGRNVGTNDV